MKSIAVQIFHQPPTKYNCAQAVIHAYRMISKDESYRPEDFKALGGGKAPEGICGALFAACKAHSEDAASLTERFGVRLGAVTCKELKSRATPCVDCVGVAAELLEESLKGKHGGIHND